LFLRLSSMRLKGLGMSYPKISAEKRQELLSIRDQLTSDEAVDPT